MKTMMVVSGGDAPGINTALARYSALAAAGGDTVCGAVGGFEGLLHGEVIPLAQDLLAPFAAQPGSYLTSSREPVLSHIDAEDRLKRILKAHNIDNLVLFGGNGTLYHVLPLLADWDIPCIALPVTIDNDVPGTEYTLGFDSACNYAYQAVDGLRATAQALPGRVFMLETLGGNTGFLALAVAYGAGAQAVLIPEIPYRDDWLADRLRAAIAANGHALLVISEGTAAFDPLREAIPRWTGTRMRDIRLGHAQRGGIPTHHDRTIAGHMARMAYHALRDGLRLGVVVMRDGKPLLNDGLLTDTAPPQPDRTLYDFINGLAEQ